MSATRRVALQGSAAAVAMLLWSRALVSPAKAQGPGPVRLPLKEFATDQRRVDSLRRGVQAMRSRAPSDPRSWFFQGAVHALNDALLADALLVDPNVAAVDSDKFWNQCPHFGQNSANFLIWHRAYLHYFERILRDAAQDADLALPYWNYEDPEERRFPALFAPQFYAQGGRSIPNPLYHPNREAAFTSGRYELAWEVAEYRTTRAVQEFFGQDESSGLAGGIGDDNPGSQGMIERRPHNDIHLAVGGVIGSGNGAMADVPTAAFDPIFWVHHANIDRIWVEWSCASGKTWGVLPTQAWLQERPWFFHDFDGAVKNESRMHYMNPRTLDIRFKSDDPQCHPLELPSVVAAASGLQMRASRLRELGQRLSVARTISVSPERGARAVVQGGAILRAAAGTAPPSARAAAARSERRVFLVLSGIAYDRVPSAGFAVHVNPASSGELNSGSASYVGSLALFGLMHHAHGPAGSQENTQSFDITARVQGDRLAQGQIEVRVVPYDLLQPRGGAPAFRRPDAVRIREMQIVVAERVAS